MQRVTASQASFQTLIGEPRHTKPRAARVDPGQATVVYLGVRFSVH
jgi:hypothetical protein